MDPRFHMKVVEELRQLLDALEAARAPSNPNL